MMTTDPSASFEPHRRRLLGLAYRMLGSMAEAEDAVQQAYLRWHDADRASVADPRGFLMTTTARICLDVLALTQVVRAPPTALAFRSFDVCDRPGLEIAA